MPDGRWQFPRVSIGWEPSGQGYIVQCFEGVDSDSCILSTSSVLSEPAIEVEAGGFARELWPKELFVSHARAVQALDHFLATGSQNPSLDWIGLRDFARLRASSD